MMRWMVWIGAVLACLPALPAAAQTGAAPDWRVVALVVAGQNEHADDNMVLYVDKASVTGTSAEERGFTMRIVFEHAAQIPGADPIRYIDFGYKLDCAARMIRRVHSVVYSIDDKQIRSSNDPGDLKPAQGNDASRAAATVCLGNWEKLPPIVGTPQNDAPERFAERAALIRSVSGQNWYWMPPVGEKPNRQINFLDRDSIAVRASGGFDASLVSFDESGQFAAGYSLFRVRVDCTARNAHVPMAISYTGAGAPEGVSIDPAPATDLEAGSDLEILANAQCRGKWDPKNNRPGTIAAVHSAAFP